VINNTGGPPAGALAQATIQDLTQALNNHLFASHAILQAVLPAMQAQQWGRIINIISTSVKAPLHNLGVSNTTRAAVANWSKTLANELGKYNITVNNVLPGATDTGRLQAIIQHKASAQHTDIQHIIQQMQNEIPLQRFAQPEEIAAAVGFLASDAAAYITGINLPVDGGRTPNL
jgi:3-oxoacyl-[acyl-carrier protein] reductase